MPKFSDIIGQEHIKEHIRKSIISEKISHAYIINGEKGSGKKLLANMFAMTLQCEKKGTEPCMVCRSCKQYVTKNQPDVVTLIPEKPKTISVNDIREQIISDISIKPYSSKYKIYLIENCELMTVQAQNALLKTLEEPPEYAVIMLMTSNIDAFLDTVRSRCTVLNIRPIEDHIIRKYLMEELEVVDYQAEVCLAFARGNIGRAESLAKSGDFENIKNDALYIIRHIQKMDMGEINKAIKKMEDYKLQIQDLLDIILIWYRDILVYKSTKRREKVIFKDEIKSIKASAEEMDYEGIEKIIEAINQTRDRLRANVNFDMVIELLLLAIKEA